MQSSNQHCNALQSMIGIFLHSCGVLEAAIELFAHIGLSISTTAINNAISSLSKGSTEEMQGLGRTLLAGYAYDNLDIDLKHGTPTIERPMATLLHMTSATMLQLDHGITHEDLNCSWQLWEWSALNRHRQSETPVVDEDALLNIHPEDEDHSSGLLRRDHFNVHVVLHYLVEHGPKGFHKFLKHIRKPEVIEQIPIVKSRQVPLRMMDISPATPATNRDVLAHILHQGGVDDTAIENQVVLVHGDLLTEEQIQSLLLSCSAEKNPWLHFQFVVYIMGLFHLKMVCADAIW
jgi:hypothetical protein